MTLGLSRSAAAQVYLVGAGLYSSSSTGASAASGYLYDTNTVNPTFTLQLVLNGTTYNKGIAIPLTNGANNFTINTSPSGVADPGTYGGLELFFSASATSYNPSTTARTPDLVVGVNINGTPVDFTPSSGVQVESYNYNAFVGANGLSTFTVEGKNVQATNFVATHSATGSFTIGVSAGSAPEPGAAVLALLGAAPLAVGFARRAARRS